MELQVLQGIQSIANPLLDQMFVFVTMLGETYVIILILIVLYYAVDKEIGKQSIVLFGGSIFTNLFLKNLFHLPRPIGQPGIVSQRVETATGFSFPSGHTQSFTTLYLCLKDIIKRRWFAVAGLCLVFLVGLSRLYLGVHWPKDVLVGWVLAVLSVKIGIVLCKKYSTNAILGIVVIFLHLSLLAYLDHDLVKFAGVMLGAWLGFVIESKYIGFSNTLILKIKILRVLGGVVVVFGVYLGLKLLLPPSLLSDYFRYAMVGLTACAGFPFVIQRYLK